ncbi:DUF3618 domain-containing protein [Leifsonia aquatica]|uniref:DUF3618 domain-containing protein n=1 Tax=Leifsonia aquatica TaxID=144185 RepID=UPI0038510A4C
MTTDRSDVDRARAELAATLDAIEYKLNAPERATQRVKTLASQNPLAFTGVVVGVAAAVGGVVWGIARLTRR